MKVKSIISTFVSLGVMTLLGCGGGGGGSAPAPTPPPPVGSITISGVVAKGPLNGADVAVYAVDKNTGKFDRTLGTIANGKTSTDGSGKYSINILNPPTGAVIIEVTGGTYTDEASGTADVKLTALLRAIVSAVADGDKIAVTPFTEMAYKKAEGIGTGAAGTLVTFTKSSIDDSNSSIAKTFGIDNVITTLPFDPTSAAAAATATPSQKKYSAALGTFSQLTNNNVPTGTTVTAATLGTATDNLLKDLGTQVAATGGINQTSLDSYNTAASTFNLPANTKNQTGTVAPIIKFTGGVLSISTSGTLPAGGVTSVINGIDMTLTLPAGVTVAADVLGQASAGVIVPSSNAVSNSVVVSKYTPATLVPAAAGTLRIIITNVQPGFAVGEFMHINFLGFPTGLNIKGPPDPLSFKLAFNGDGIFGGVANGTSTAALTGITIKISQFVGL